MLQSLRGSIIGKKRRRMMRGSVKQQTAYMFMLIPGLAMLFCFSYLPMPGVLLAFEQYQMTIPGADAFLKNPFLYSLFNTSEWVGLENFKFLLTDAFMLIRNTVGYNVIFMATGLVLQVALAVVISEMRNRRGAKLYHTIMFMPYFVSWIVVMYALYALIAANGMVNEFIKTTGGAPKDFYMTKLYWPYIFLMANVWKYTGQGSIIYLATITGFDQELYEAAAMDGAGKWKQFRFITFPQLVPVIVLLQILAVGRIFNGDFDMFYSLPNGSGALRSVYSTIDVFVYNTLKNGRLTNAYGFAGAAALVQSVVGFALILTTNLIVRKVQPEMALF